MNLSASQLKEKLKRSLRETFGGECDARGYVGRPEESLLPGVELESFEDELRAGGGDELRMKFCALHSSAALAVNTFAPFKASPSNLVIGGRSGFTKVAFEHKLRTVGRAKANLDVWLEAKWGAIAIESKFLEFLDVKEAQFAESYCRAALPYAEENWWAQCERAIGAGKGHLDVAQLVKHYFALSHMHTHQTPGYYTLLYLFWEPEGSVKYEPYRKHRDELTAFAAALEGSAVSFRFMTYLELWSEWEGIPALASHTQNLKNRYAVKLPS